MDGKECFVARRVAKAVIIYNPMSDKHITGEFIDRECEFIARKFDLEFAEGAHNELQESKFNFTSFIVFKLLILIILYRIIHKCNICFQLSKR